MDLSPIALLSGPSASGKTTTAKKLVADLRRLGMNAVIISLDNYFLTVDPDTAPRTPQGDIDYESPECLDMDLLHEHFIKLAAGEEILVPYFDFTKQARDDARQTPMKLGKNDIAVFEGIHALNGCIAGAYPEAYKLYVSTLTDVSLDGGVLIRHEHLRLVRRMVRDDLFRGADPAFTLGIWDNIRRGEKLNIIPYKNSADFTIDSALPYEICVMKQYTRATLDTVPAGSENYELLNRIRNAFDLFHTVDPVFIPGDSILREFVGGSVFDY
jgi:uridine kinase